MSKSPAAMRPDEALARVEAAVLPNLSLMLDSLLDAASLARPGADADRYAAELRSFAVELDAVGRQLEQIVSPPIRDLYASASAA